MTAENEQEVFDVDPADIDMYDDIDGQTVVVNESLTITVFSKENEDAAIDFIRASQYLGDNGPRYEVVAIDAEEGLAYTLFSNPGHSEGIGPEGLMDYINSSGGLERALQEYSANTIDHVDYFQIREMYNWRDEE